MRTKFTGFLSLLICASLAGKAQNQAEGRETVMYDPLFWKEELSLKTAQERKIQEINRDFYDGLRRLREVSYSHSELRSYLDIGLQERSQRIWATLHNKQRKKLEKILEENSLQGP